MQSKVSMVFFLLSQFTHADTRPHTPLSCTETLNNLWRAMGLPSASARSKEIRLRKHRAFDPTWLMFRKRPREEMACRKTLQKQELAPQLPASSHTKGSFPPPCPRLSTQLHKAASPSSMHITGLCHRAAPVGSLPQAPEERGLAGA